MKIIKWYLTKIAGSILIGFILVILGLMLPVLAIVMPDGVRIKLNEAINEKNH